MPDAGTIGATVAALGALGSVFRAGYVVRRNNRLVLRQYEDLARWTRDKLRDEAFHLNFARNIAAQRGLQGGLAMQEEAGVRKMFAHQWRDRKSKAARDVEDVQDTENLLHRAWRSVARKPWPENPHQEEIERLSRGWEEIIEHEGL